MRRATKIILLLAVLLAVGLVVLVRQFSLYQELEKRISAQLEAQGLSHIKVSIAELDRQHVLFSHIAFSKDKTEVSVEDLKLVATALPVAEILRGNYTNVAADWSVKSLAVGGIPYELPALTGGGSYYMKDHRPVVTGELHDAQQTHRADFTFTPVTLLLENVRVLWKESALSAAEVAIPLQEKKPIYIPLRLAHLPLNTLLALISGDKATGTGDVSGGVELIIRPDGTFLFDNGKFGAEKTGLIQISPAVLPGEGAQMDIVRTALGNFHYENLSLTLDQDQQKKPIIRLNLSGRNPEAFNGREVKLQVNFSGDVLELLQQTILPMANPIDLIEKERP